MSARRILASFALLFFAAGATSAHPLQSKDSKLEVVLPDGWEAATLPNPSAKLQAKCLEKAAFCIVISESKEDFGHNSLEEYAKMILELEEHRSKLENRSVSGPKLIKLNGVDAIQYEIRGTTKNLKLHFLKTFIESPTRWNDVMCWTTPSHWEELQDDFQQINETFKVNDKGMGK